MRLAFGAFRRDWKVLGDFGQAACPNLLATRWFGDHSYAPNSISSLPLGCRIHSHRIVTKNLWSDGIPKRSMEKRKEVVCRVRHVVPFFLCVFSLAFCFARVAYRGVLVVRRRGAGDGEKFCLAFEGRQPGR